jgi:hypothetical protein
VIGDEQRVVDAFCRHLEGDGWVVSREVAFCDVVAERDGEVIYAEAKGRTKEIGLDVDTLYGQLLRRMPISDASISRFAVVVPSAAVAAATRVSPRVREMLRIDVYEVADDDRVVELDDRPARAGRGGSVDRKAEG